MKILNLLEFPIIPAPLDIQIFQDIIRYDAVRENSVSVLAQDDSLGLEVMSIGLFCHDVAMVKFFGFVIGGVMVHFFLQWGVLDMERGI